MDKPMTSTTSIVLAIFLASLFPHFHLSSVYLPSPSNLYSQVIVSNPSPPSEQKPMRPLETMPSVPTEQKPMQPLEEMPSPPVEQTSTPPTENQ